MCIFRRPGCRLRQRNSSGRTATWITPPTLSNISWRSSGRDLKRPRSRPGGTWAATPSERHHTALDTAAARRAATAVRSGRRPHDTRREYRNPEARCWSRWRSVNGHPRTGASKPIRPLATSASAAAARTVFVKLHQRTGTASVCSNGWPSSATVVIIRASSMISSRRADWPSLVSRIEWSGSRSGETP